MTWNWQELDDAELIYPVTFTPRTEYSFRHPLIRTVAYESQLKAGRAEIASTTCPHPGIA